MTFLQAIVMGIIQGLTEFLPVSSSGHLAIFQILFKVNTDTGLLYDVLLHLGTLIAVFVVYFKDIIKLIKEFILIIVDCLANIVSFIKVKASRELDDDFDGYRKVICNGYRKFVVLVIVSTIPTGIIGYVGRDLVEYSSQILIIPGICLILTSILLFVSDSITDGNKTIKNITWVNAFVVGIAQGIATMPGLSRSGTTITACLLNGYKRSFAVKYSFIMSIPAILGALVLELHDAGEIAVTRPELTAYIAGMVVSAVVGYLAIKAMLVLIKNKKFKFFGIYCLIAGIVAIAGYFLIG